MSTLRGQQASDNPHLLTCLARALCLSKSSTSSCERDFGNLIQTFRKVLASPLLKEWHIRVTSFLRTEASKAPEVVRRAQNIWNEGYLAPRLAGPSRGGNFVSGVKLQMKRQASPQGQQSDFKPWGVVSQPVSHCHQMRVDLFDEPRLQTLLTVRPHGSNGGAWR